MKHIYIRSIKYFYNEDTKKLIILRSSGGIVGQSTYTMNFYNAIKLIYSIEL